jgi:hypothetical protein
MDFWILAEIDDGAQEIEEAFVALERLEEIDECLGGELLAILRCNLDNDLQIVAKICLQHCLQTFQRILHIQATKVVDEPLESEKLNEIWWNHENYGTSGLKCCAWTTVRLMS